MNAFINDLQQRASTKDKTIVLPESADLRVLQAAAEITRKHIAKIVLIGEPEQINKTASENELDLNDVTIISPTQSLDLRPFIVSLTKKREHRGMTLHLAEELLTTDPLFFGAMLVESKKADGMVAGSINPTSATIKAALQCVGMHPDISSLSSFFIMILPDRKFGQGGILFYADCAVIPHPTSQQLADIAVSTAKSYSTLLEIDDPKIAMLSFSSKGSSKDDSIVKIQDALISVKAHHPELKIDGELQFDAALIPEIASSKAPDSKVAGHADILIFPDLNSGNIAYKITERLGGAQAIGPIFQGIKKPINDLSRGCSVEDIINVTAITVLQCK